MTKTQKERIRRFLRDLRSGKYRQARGMLKRRKDTYCCLGVACERYRRDTGKGRWSKDRGDDYRFLGSSDVLPSSVVRYFGLKQDNPTLVLGPDARECATDLNDERRWNFRRIADAFERTFLGTVKGKKVSA